MASQYIPVRSGTGLMITRANAVSIQLDSDDDVLKFKDTDGNVRCVVAQTDSSTMPKTTIGVGAAVAAKCSAVEYGIGPLHQTVLTLAMTGSNDLDLAGNADNSIGVKIYDFPAGRILVLGVTVNLSVTVNDAFNASTDDVFELSLGSADATQAANGALTGTETDLLALQTLDTVSNTVLTHTVGAALAASAHFDGTSSALDMYVNAAVLNASTSKAVTIAITGTVTITWLQLGDY